MMNFFYVLTSLLFLLHQSLAQFPDDRNILIEFYNSLAQPNDLSWDISSNLCLVPEISCDENNRVTKIIIVNKNLNVPIPSSFGNLHVLGTLIISNSKFVGPIPQELSNLNFLKILDLSSNTFGGKIPDQFSFLSLTTLDLSKNQLNGTIPASLFSTNLEILNLQNNFLDGTLPKSIKNSFKLIDLNLSNNLLSGRIPPEVAISSLDSIKLNNNRFIGGISESIRTKVMSRKFFDQNFLDCPAPLYQGKSEDDYNSFVQRCADISCSTCPESCKIQGTNYDTKMCQPYVPCTTELSQYDGIPGDVIFFYGSNYFPGNVICRFGSRTVQGKFATGNYIECPVTVSQKIQNVTASVSINGVQDACGAPFKFTSASGVLDPHFYGFHGEKMEVKKDSRASNQLFHLYCSQTVTVTTLFYEYNDGLLFMTKFWVRLGSTQFTLHLSTTPKVIQNQIRKTTDGKDDIIILHDLGRKRIEIEGGHLEWDDNMLRAKFGYLNIVFSNKIYLNNSPYMNIDFYVVGIPPENEKATGIIGRTLKNRLTTSQFEEYLQFKGSVDDVLHFSCPSSLSLEQI